MHPDQVHVSDVLVRRLIDDQFPQWRGLPVRPVASHGTVNALFRIGDGIAARFPLRPAGGHRRPVSRTRDWLISEAAAARELLGRTRFCTPEPLVIGEPGAGFPLPWAVQTWLPGTVATEADPCGSAAFAADLAEFVGGMRAMSTGARTFSGPGRGGDLHSHDAWMQTCLRRSEGLLDVERLRRFWDVLRELPRSSSYVMNHGDLTPGNVLVSSDRLVGVIDVGGFGPADPALDLVAGWHLLDSGPRQVFRHKVGSDELEWSRGMAWAFEQAMGLAWYYLDSNPVMSALGRRTLKRILAAGIPI